MAEFQDVMKQFDRMCKANTGCLNCPLHAPNGVEGCTMDAFVNDSERIEREVMTWAVEHPEPVYPTWKEYFTEKGFLLPNWNELSMPPYNMYKYAEWL